MGVGIQGKVTAATDPTSFIGHDMESERLGVFAWGVELRPVYLVAKAEFTLSTMASRLVS